jgi:hypothetical protein
LDGDDRIVDEILATVLQKCWAADVRPSRRRVETTIREETEWAAEVGYCNEEVAREAECRGLRFDDLTEQEVEDLRAHVRGEMLGSMIEKAWARENVDRIVRAVVEAMQGEGVTTDADAAPEMPGDDDDR